MVNPLLVGSSTHFPTCSFSMLTSCRTVDPYSLHCVGLETRGQGQQKPGGETSRGRYQYSFLHLFIQMLEFEVSLIDPLFTV